MANKNRRRGYRLGVNVASLLPLINKFLTSDAPDQYANCITFIIIRKMPKTLEDVTDSGSHICALDKG